MVTFRQLGDLFGFTMEKEPWNIKEGTPKVWATIADGVLFLKVQGCSDQEPSLEICAQGSCQHLLCKEGTGQSMREKSSSLTWESSPSSHAQGWEEDQRR
ncbi:unnamed protein product [Microthlaspi erraticum]|uniref:Uncharacterized protein n=1 Tax=Microthlaspi erraticum TaxID=1685480 RepID=A0A6D2K0H7_9BRAS|nr:unnamed protein product [Microthlaspi erraticum]